MAHDKPYRDALDEITRDILNGGGRWIHENQWVHKSIRESGGRTPTSYGFGRDPGTEDGWRVTVPSHVDGASIRGKGETPKAALRDHAHRIREALGLSRIENTGTDERFHNRLARERSVDPSPSPAAAVALFVRRKGSPDSPVASIEESARRWNEFRDRSGAGVSEIGNGVVVLDGSGRMVARITYNGRVWLPGEERFNDSLGAFDDPPEPRHHGRFHVSRHALGQSVQGSLGRGGIEYEVFDSGEKPSRIVFVSRNEDEAIAESRRLNAGGTPRVVTPPVSAPKPEWIAAPALPPVPPGKARCSVCGKVGPKAKLKKHEAGCQSGDCGHAPAKQGSLFGNPTPTERDVAKRIAAERKKRGR